MKLLLLTHCFYPSQKRGGPTVSMSNMAKLAAEFMDVSVATIGYYSDGTPYQGIHEGKNSLFGCDVYYLKNNKMADFAQIIQEIAPDVMYVSSLFSWQYCVPALRIAKKKKRKNTTGMKVETVCRPPPTPSARTTLTISGTPIASRSSPKPVTITPPTRISKKSIKADPKFCVKRNMQKLSLSMYKCPI